SDDVDHVHHEEEYDPKAFSGPPDEQQQYREGTNRPPGEHEEAQLAEAEIDLVDEEREQRIDEAVEDASRSEDDGRKRERDTVSGVLQIAHQADEGVEDHRRAVVHL